MRIVDLGVNVTTNTNGATIRVLNSPGDTFTIHLFGTGTFTVAIEGSTDGTNWDTLVSGKTADEIFTVAKVPYIRFVTSGMASANVTIRAVI